MANLGTRAGVEGALRFAIRARSSNDQGEIVRKASSRPEFQLTTSCYDPSPAGVPAAPATPLAERGYAKRDDGPVERDSLRP
jgi:hypothetical protein